jgi:selenocysteine lyase/cysteine desulfurase
MAFTRNTTEALNTVIRGLELQAGDEVLITALEYDTIAQAWRQRALRDSLIVRTIPIPAPGTTADDLVAAFERAIGARTRAMSSLASPEWISTTKSARLMRSFVIRYAMRSETVPSALPG